MRSSSVVFACIAAALALPAVGGEIVDATGRTVKVDDPVSRIAAAGPPAEVLLYAFAPDALIGWVRDVPPRVAPFLTSEAKALPTVGAVTAQGDAPEISEILARKPQLIVDFGDVDARYGTLAEKMQAHTGIPYALLDGKLAKTPETLRVLGKLTGRGARAEELATYAEGLLTRARKIAAEHAGNPTKVYIARSADGSISALAGSHPGDVYDLAGLKNIAEYEDATPVQVAGWDPDLIVALDPKFRDATKSAAWSPLRAVRDGRILTPPRGPWGWTDSPPSVNRLLGVLWLTSKVYGQPTTGELRTETSRFYKTFFHLELTPEQLSTMVD